MRLERIYRYPVKGLSAEAMADVDLSAGETLPHDRRFALAQADAPFDELAPRFLPKQNFACLMANARLALLHSAFDPRRGRLSIRWPGEPAEHFDVASEAGRAGIARRLTALLGDEARGELRFLDVPGHAFTDQPRKGVSLINLASLADVELKLGVRLDPLRFRANFYFSGLPAWAELDWIGQEVQLGRARLSVFKRTVRCPATQVNLETGERDVDVPRLMRAAFGHADLGVHATVIAGGRVAVGDSLEALVGAG
jgi:uncharacterized protein YcbX